MVAFASTAAQAPWSGWMHPNVPMSSNCSLAAGDDCAPTYEQLAAAGELWECPAGTTGPGTCGIGGSAGPCVPGNGSNPLCMSLNASAPCCCPRDGCYTKPEYNWIIGVCKGLGCGCGKSRAPSCAPNGQSGRCGSACTGDDVPCCFGADVSPLVPFYNEGTHAVINYIAAYAWNASLGAWSLSAPSSFNTDARLPPFDLLRPYGGLAPDQAWLAPQPGGSVFWSLGYYPAGVPGLGPPGAMFVLSSEDWFAGTWYALNSLTLDRGPGESMPASMCPNGVNDNCWAAGNAGEIDFLEAPWNSPLAADMNYTQSFTTTNNQAGRCVPSGINTGGFASANYLLTEGSPINGSSPVPIVYVAIIDSVGTWVYRILASQISRIWPGLGRYTANATVRAAPTETVGSVNPGVTDFAMTFASNCQATNYADALAQECMFNGQQGFCNNVFAQMVNTGQPLFPGPNCTRDVRGGVTMPWCVEMVPSRPPRVL